MPTRKPELERIIKDLKVFVSDACQYDPAKCTPDNPGDAVSEMCNDACLMLEQARGELDKKGKA